jgi:hypothetical protein
MDMLSRAIGSIDREQKSYPLPKDLLLVPLCALFFPSLLIFLDRWRVSCFFSEKKKLCVGVCVVGEDRLGSKSFRWWGNIDVCGGATVVVGVGSEL